MVTIRYYATLMATPPEDHYGMTNSREQCPTTCTVMEYHAHTNQNTYFQILVKDQTSLLTGPITQLPLIPEPVLPAKTPLKLPAKRQKGYAANQGSLEKHRNWDSISIANTLQILPLSIEDGGTMHPEFTAAIKHVALTSNNSNPGANRISRTYWTQRILVANAKGVAHTIINHMPTCRNNSCKCNKEVHQPTLIPIQRNAHYNSNAALQATNTTVPTVQHTPITSVNSIDILENYDIIHGHTPREGISRPIYL